MHQQRARAGLILTIANLLTAALGLAVGLYIARSLGAESLGAAGVAIAIVAIVANFCDLRVADLATRGFYQPNDEENVELLRRAALLRSCLALTLIIAATTAVLSMLALAICFTWFSAVEVSQRALVLFSIAGGFTAVSSFFAFLHRLGEWVRPMVMFQLGAALTRAALIGSWLMFSPHIESYAWAYATSEFVTMVASIVVALILWRRIAPLRLLRAAPVDVKGLLNRERHFFFAANVMGYIKLLHRGGDILLVGWFCGDHQTGLYRLARSLADGALVLQDAVSRAFQPAMLRWIADRAVEQFRRTARAITGLGAVVSIVVTGGALLFGDFLIRKLVGPQFDGSAAILAVLALSVVFAVGLQGWLLAARTAHNRLGGYTRILAVSTLVGQYLVGISLYEGFANLGPLAFAIGHVLTHVLTFAAAFLMERRVARAYVPF